MVASTGSFQDAQWLGAEGEKPKNVFVAVFIPSRTRNDSSVDHDKWRDEAVELMSDTFGGATSIKARGGWLDEERGGKVKVEDISIVFSFFTEEEWHQENVSRLKEFLYRMGRDAEQGAVGLYLMRGEERNYIEIPSERYEEEQQ